MLILKNIINNLEGYVFYTHSEATTSLVHK